MDAWAVQASHFSHAVGEGWRVGRAGGGVLAHALRVWVGGSLALSAPAMSTEGITFLACLVYVGGCRGLGGGFLHRWPVLACRVQVGHVCPHVQCHLLALVTWWHAEQKSGVHLACLTRLSLRTSLL